MFTGKIRTIIVTLLAAVAVGVVPATSHAIKATPTGDRAQDDYCNKVAELINYATAEGDRAIAEDRGLDAAAWYALAVDMQSRSAKHGCMWVGMRKIKRLRVMLRELGPVEISPEISSQITVPRPPRHDAQETAPTEPGTTQGETGTSTGGTTAPGGDGPTVSGPMGG